MKKLLLCLASFLAVVGARADFHGDLDAPGIWLNAANPTYTGTLSLLAPFGLLPAFDPTSQEIIGAGFEFSFGDPLLGGGSESFKVNLGTDDTLISTHGSFFLITLVTGTITPGSYPNLLQDLSEDGELQYTITRTSGSFSFTSAGILAESRDLPPRNVPDTGATLSLLGVGLLGLAALKRKLA